MYKILTIFLVALICSVSMPNKSMAEATAADLLEKINLYGYGQAVSLYEWRGVAMRAGEPAFIQGLLGAEAAGIVHDNDAFYASMFFSSQSDGLPLGGLGRNAIEFNFKGGYRGNYSGVTYDLGVTQYSFLHAANANFTEAYFALGYDDKDVFPVKIVTTGNYTFKGRNPLVQAPGSRNIQNRDIWIDVNLSTQLLGLNLEAGAGFAKWKKNILTRPIATMYKDGLNYLYASIGHTTHLTAIGEEFDFTIYLKGTSTLGGSSAVPVLGAPVPGVKFIYGVPTVNEALLGMRFSYH